MNRPLGEPRTAHGCTTGKELGEQLHKLEAIDKELGEQHMVVFTGKELGEQFHMSATDKEFSPFGHKLL